MAGIAFETENLNVHHMKVQGLEYNDERECFVGYFRDEQWPGQVVCVTVWRRQFMQPPNAYIDWIQTSRPWRRQGYATEIVRGIEAYLKLPLIGDGATKAGVAFCRAAFPDQEQSDEFDDESSEPLAGIEAGGH